jgi:hypothetical protein
MQQRIPFQWNNANFQWNDNPYTWDDCALVIEILQQGGGAPVDYLNQRPEKKKQFIKLLCKVQGKEYKETKEVHKTKIFIRDVKLVAKEVLGVDVKINK